MFGTVAPDGSQVYGLPTMQNAAVHIRTIPSTRPVVALSDQMLLSRQLRDFLAGPRARSHGPQVAALGGVEQHDVYRLS